MDTLTAGALNGKSVGKTKSKWYVPPLYGLSDYVYRVNIFYDITNVVVIYGSLDLSRPLIDVLVLHFDGESL